MALRRAADEPLVVGDLFCGGGGFSEGFRQAGFKIAWAVDHWAPAVETFKKNHPGADVRRANILSLNPGVLRDIAKVDVLIGSPPCIHFSAANRGGNGDRLEGLRLVRKFLTFVRELRPKYWVMENVAGMLPDLLEEMVGDSITLNSGDLRIPRMQILDAAAFGAPQTRKRSFSGRFPAPTVTHGEGAAAPRTLRSVLANLPSPSEPRPSAGNKIVRDPVYDGYYVAMADLRDHFEDTRWRLTREDQRVSREAKIHNSVYGVMSYPDDLDRPSRTITATRTRGSRMTIVVPYGVRGRRALTLRESASAQGFPLSYQFWASSMSDRDVLVGNAVSPPTAHAVAKAILEAEGGNVPSSPILRPPPELAPVLTPRRFSTRRYSAYRRFRGVIPVEWRHDHRLELDNGFLGKDLPFTDQQVPPTDWKARVYLGYAKLYKQYEVRLEDGIALAAALSAPSSGLVPEDQWARMLTPLLLATSNGFPRSDQLQAVWTGRSRRYRSPIVICESVGDLVHRSFPSRDWKDREVPITLSHPILSPLTNGHGKEAEAGQPLPMSVRLAASTVALSIICERLNRGVKRLDEFTSELTAGPGFLPRMVAAAPRRPVARVFEPTSRRSQGRQPLEEFAMGR
jgi:DNA (cytosine-5)-methyltransferase 1